MRERALRLGAAVLLAALAGCYNGKGTESGYATPAPGAVPPGGAAPAAQPAAPAGHSAAPAAQTPAPASPFGTPRYAFGEHYADGKINSETPAGTPNHRGALVLPVATNEGRQQALTVLASYTYSFSVGVQRGDVLAFEAGKPWNLGVDTQGFVQVDPGGKPERVFEAALPPAGANGVVWRTFTRSLDRYAGKTVTITFGASAIGGNAIAAWISFPYAGLYRATAPPKPKR
jgi:hypothetical protein